MANQYEQGMAELFAGLTSMQSGSSAEELQEPKQKREQVSSVEVSNNAEDKPKKKAPSKNRSKKDKESRKVSFLLRITDENLEKMRNLSNISGINVSDLIDYSVKRMLQSYEKRHGVIPETKKKSVKELL